MSERQLPASCVVAVVLWVLAAVMLAVGTALICWPCVAFGLFVTGGAMTASLRAMIIRYGVSIHDAVEFGRDSVIQLDTRRR